MEETRNVGNGTRKKRNSTRREPVSDARSLDT